MEYQECGFFEVSCHIDNLGILAQEILQWFYELFLGAALEALKLIPVPDFLTDISFTVPSGVMWFASALELPYGIGVVLAAYVARFALRRIPFIG